MQMRLKPRRHPAFATNLNGDILIKIQGVQAKCRTGEASQIGTVDVAVVDLVAWHGT